MCWGVAFSAGDSIKCNTNTRDVQCSRSLERSGRGLMLSTGSTCFEDHKPSLFVLRLLRHAGLGSSVLILQMCGKKTPPASLCGSCSALLRVLEAAQRSRPLHLQMRERRRIRLQMTKFVQSLNCLTTALHSRSRSSSLVSESHRSHQNIFSQSVSGGRSNSHR